nr:hypothetical protein [Tanacetum cinerariifolium]
CSVGPGNLSSTSQTSV